MGDPDERYRYAHCLAVTLDRLGYGDPTNQQELDDHAERVAEITSNLLDDPEFLTDDIE